MTSKEWKKVKLSTLCKIKGGKRLPKGCNLVQNKTKHPYIRVRDLANIKNLELNSSFEYIEDNVYNKIKNYTVNTGDVIISIVGTIGLVSIIKESLNNANLTENCAKLINLKNINNNFLYYFLSSELGQNEIKKGIVGAVQQKLPLYSIEDINIPLPPLEIQEKIARVLSSLDDKIELNNKINQNLEQQAQAIFKSWFVDIHDSKNYSEKFGNLPKDAIVSSVSDIDMLITDYVANGSFASLKENVKLYQEPNYAYFIRNTDLKSNTFNVYVDRHSYDFLSKSVLYGNEIIISNVGDVGSVFLCPKLDKPMTLGNNIIMLRPNKVEMLYYLYIWFKWSYGQDLIQGIKGGSAQPKFNKTDFKSLQIITPSEGMLNNFNKIVAPMFQIIENNSKENVFLAQLRDTLLQKLMNGEIDVDKVKV